MAEIALESPRQQKRLRRSWLLGFALLFAVLIGLLSGIYPALQGATLIPVRALKYE